MPTYTYTVANQEGKKLSGNVEAPDEQSARSELNNLGFSILSLKESSQAAPTPPSTGKKFVFEAIDKNSKQVNGSIASDKIDKAFKRLQKEYGLTVTAIWNEGASEQQIAEAKKFGTEQLQVILQKELLEKEGKKRKKELKSQEAAKKAEIMKQKIETILSEINQLLQRFDEFIETDQKVEINKKINKLLRIKNSKNLDYIVKTAEDLLNFIQSQEKTLMEKGQQDKRIELRMETRELLRTLAKTEKPKSLAEDIVSKIGHWQDAHKDDTKKGKTFTKLINNFLEKIRKAFETPPEILAIKEQIRVYNKQLFEFIQLYFKEPTKEYKSKVKNAIKSIWQARKKAKENIKIIKKQIKQERKKEAIEEHLTMSFIQELNSLTGWILGFYILYYFISIYINTKDFGLTEIPEGFMVYKSQFFKYILVILFLLHSCSALKINFFRKSTLANIFLPIFFVFASIITLLNF